MAVHYRRKEDTAVNRLISWDCLLNILTMLMAVFYQSSWYNMHSEILCSIGLFTVATLISWNRMVSVAIVVFRYMMVCSAQGSVVRFRCV